MSEGQSQAVPQKVDEKASKKAAQKKALLTIKEFVDKSGKAELVEALKIYKPSLYGIGGGGRSGGGVMDQFISLVKERKQITEEDVFKVMKIGRKEAATLIRKHLKKAAPAERVWIEFDVKNGNYIHKGNGQTPPQGWTGFVPVANVTNIK